MSKSDVKLLRAAVSAGLIFGLTACHETGKQVSPELPVAEETQTVGLGNEISTAPKSLSEQIKFAKNELAQRLGIEPESITLSEASQVNWRSGAMGCPKTGMSYTQALVPGSLIFFKVGDEIHAYHVKHGGKPFYCPGDRAEQPVFDQGADMT